MKFSHKLMYDNFTKSDLQSVVKLLKTKNIILTQSKNVKKFEIAWSKWLGVRYSVFVNSGSSANLLTIAILKILYKKKRNYSSDSNLGLRYKFSYTKWFQTSICRY